MYEGSKEEEILIVEELDTHLKKFNNLKDLEYLDCIDKNMFIKDINSNSTKYKNNISKIFHLGACSKTTEPDRDYIMSTNFIYSGLMKLKNFSFIYSFCSSQILTKDESFA